jgi:hypothetical protein
MIKKADAYTWMAQWHDGAYVRQPGNWIKYEDYMKLWEAYQQLLKSSPPLARSASAWAGSPGISTVVEIDSGLRRGLCRCHPGAVVSALQDIRARLSAPQKGNDHG